MAPRKPKGRDFIADMKSTGEELAKVRLDIRTREERWKEETDHLFAREKELKEKLLSDLQGAGMASFKASSGESYIISKSFDFSITNPIAYDKFARDNRCVRVDSTAMRQRINAAVKAGTKLDFIEVKERETISVRSAKKPDAKEEA